MAYTKQHLSGSTDGVPIQITGTATGSANTIHTGPAGTTTIDEVYFSVSNASAADARLTVEWGSTSDPAGLLVKAYVVPHNSPPIWIATGHPISNSKVVKAFADTASVLNIVGYVNRIN